MFKNTNNAQGFKAKLEVPSKRVAGSRINRGEEWVSCPCSQQCVVWAMAQYFGHLFFNVVSFYFTAFLVFAQQYSITWGAFLQILSYQASHSFTFTSLFNTPSVPPVCLNFPFLVAPSSSLHLYKIAKFYLLILSGH